MALYDLVKFTTATTGTGTITVGSATDGGRTLLGAGIPDGTVVSYGVLNGNGDRGVERGTVGGSGTTLTRGHVSSTTGSLLNLSGATIFITPLAAFSAQLELIPGQYYYPLGALQDNGSAGADIMKAAPFSLLTPIKIAEINMRTASVYGTGNLTWGIYAASPTGYPIGDPLILHTFTGMANNTTYTKTGINYLLPQGNYWLVSSHAGAFEMKRANSYSSRVLFRCFNDPILSSENAGSVNLTKGYTYTGSLPTLTGVFATDGWNNDTPYNAPAFSIKVG